MSDGCLMLHGEDRRRCKDYVGIQAYTVFGYFAKARIRFGELRRKTQAVIFCRKVLGDTEHAQISIAVWSTGTRYGWS